ncbi:MAG: hypothetical protein M1821_001095 [Bathelium mastoideum]|nr:MAG: hypothetical protein M1821_001095 [Bathelium mastoideum]
MTIITLSQDTFFLLFISALRLFVGDAVTKQRSRIRGPHTPYFEPKTILVTGVGMSKGLALARHFHAAGHNVIGADFEPFGALNPGRVSRSIRRFYPLNAPSPQQGAKRYVQSLLDIIAREHVQLWVSCSGVASAVEDGEAKEAVERATGCKAVQFDPRTTRTLHEKDSFIARTAELGLNVPETHTITSHEEALRILKGAKREQFILKSLVLDDASRANMTLLPRSSDMETEKHVNELRISPQTPWVLQQFIKGPEYCTHALVVKGIVRAFVACPSSDLLMHYEALPHESPLTHAMLDFTCKFAERHGESFTGHLSFDFLVADAEVEEMKRRGKTRGATVNLWPIECNPRAHTAIVLFDKNPDMVDAYLDLLDLPKDAFTRQKQQRAAKVNGFDLVDGDTGHPFIWPEAPHNYFWSGHDLVTLTILPIISWLTSFFGGRPLPTVDIFNSFHLFFNHLVLWKDGTFEFWDPWPWWWLYHVYWPMRFTYYALSGKRWSRINVSTGKVFEF